MPTVNVEEHLPSVYSAADKTSGGGQTRFKRGTGLSLLMLIVAASFGLVEKPWAGWVSGAALLVSIAVGALVVFRDAEDDWYDGRAVAESAKTLAWKYAVGGQPFSTTSDDAEAAYDRALKGVVAEIRTLRGPIDVSADTTGIEHLREVRTSTLERRREIYCQQRLEEQHGWYRSRAEEHRTTARNWQRTAAALQAAALVLAALKGLDVVSLDLMAVFAATATAAIAWLGAGDYVKTARAYELTTLELEQARGVLGEIHTEDTWATFVADAEQILSREHTAWQARRRGGG